MPTSFVTLLGGTVVTVALRANTDERGGGITTQQWVVDAYLIILSAGILLVGSLSDARARSDYAHWAGLTRGLVTLAM